MEGILERNAAVLGRAGEDLVEFVTGKRFKQFLTAFCFFAVIVVFKIFSRRAMQRTTRRKKTAKTAQTASREAALAPEPSLGEAEELDPDKLEKVD